MTLVDRLPLLLTREPTIRLIIIDSLAALFRSEDIMLEHHTKANTLQYFGFAMHTLCQRYNLAIVCVNQVYKYTFVTLYNTFCLGTNSIRTNY
jgi:RecA/RadA recombinase